MADDTQYQDVQNQGQMLPVHFGFSNDFKSAAMWTLIGIIGGMALMHWIASAKYNKPGFEE